MAYFTASYQHLLRTSTHQGPKAPSVWCGFPYHISSPTAATQLATARNSTGNSTGSSNSTELYNGSTPNRMFDRHQAEITVMQFRGHSLPVHQSMSVPWEFFYHVPFHQPISAHAISSPNCHWNVSLPSGASPWIVFWAWSKGQNITRAHC